MLLAARFSLPRAYMYAIFTFYFVVTLVGGDDTIEESMPALLWKWIVTGYTSGCRYLSGLRTFEGLVKLYLDG